MWSVLKYVEIARALGDNSQAYPQSAPTPNTRYVLLLRKLGVPRQPAGIQETLLGAEAVTGLEGCKHRGTRNKLPHGSRMELVTCFFGGKSRSMYLQPGLMSCTHKNTYVLIYVYIYIRHPIQRHLATYSTRRQYPLGPSFFRVPST